MHLDIYTCTGRRWDVCIIWVCICIVYIHMICILHYRYLSALFLEMLQKQKWNLLTRLFTFASSAGVGFGLWGWKSLGTYVRHGGYLVGSPSRKMRVPEIFFFYLIGPIWWLKNPRFFKNYSGVISTYIGSLTSLHALPAKVSLVSGFTQVWCSSLSLPLRCCALRLNVFCHMNPYDIYVRMCVCECAWRVKYAVRTHNLESGDPQRTSQQKGFAFNPSPRSQFRHISHISITIPHYSLSVPYTTTVYCQFRMENPLKSVGFRM